jgi:hypothetical protein
MNEHVARVGGSTEMLRATVRGFSGKNWKKETTWQSNACVTW